MTRRPIALATVLMLCAAVEVKAAPEPPDLRGLWAALHVTSTVADIPVIGDVENLTKAWLLVQIRQKGPELKVTHKVCRLVIDTDTKSIQMQVPRAFVKAVRRDSYGARLKYKDGRWAYERPEIVRLRGMRSKKPLTDPLPVDVEDSRVFDMDEDGHPGVTFGIKGMVNGRIYFVSRDISSMAGFVDAPKDGPIRIDGLVSLSGERRVLSASNPILGGSPPSRAHPDAKRSYFRMTKVPKSTRCRDVVSQAPRLFKRGD